MATIQTQHEEQSKALLPGELHTATEALAESVLATEPFVAYRQAEARLHEDREARSLLDRLQACQASIRQKQANGQVTPEDLQNLRTLQNGVKSNQTIANYVIAQEDAIASLRDLNREISQLLRADFAALARRSCC